MEDPSIDLKPFVQPPPPITFKQAGIQPDPILASGQRLPARLRARLDKSQYGIPLKDPDPAYHGFNTFVVVTDRSGTLTRFNSHLAMSIFPPVSPLRVSAINILNHWSYSWLFAILIVGNYWTRQMWENGDPYHGMGGWIAMISEILFLTACVFDMTLKWVAYGVGVGPFTTMKSLWAWLDVVLIVTGVLMIWWPIRVFRAIAAARTLKIVPASRQLLYGCNFLIRTKEKLFDVLIYSVIIIVALTLVGMAGFGGLLRQKCIQHPTVAGDAEAMETWNSDPTHWLLANGSKEDFYVCGNESMRPCPENYICLAGYGLTPDHDYTAFDNWGWAVLTTIRVIAQDMVETLYMQIPTTSTLQQLLYFLTSFFLGTWAIVGFGFALTASEFEEDDKEDARATGQEANMDEEDRPPVPASRGRAWAHGIIYGQGGWWDKFIVLISLVVLLLFCWHYYGIHEDDPQTLWILRGGLTFCLVIYILDTAFQLIADGPLRFICGPRGVLHVYESLMIIVILAKLVHWFIVDFGIDFLDTVLYTLPLVKLATRWRALRLLLRVAWTLIFCSRRCAFFCLAALATIVLGEVGLMLFASEYNESGKNPRFAGRNDFPPRWTFGDLPHAWLLVLRVMCGEWVASLWNCMLVGNATCLVYFIATLFIMYLILMHINVAIIMTTVQELKKSPAHCENESDGGGRNQTNAFPALFKDGGALGKVTNSKYLGWLSTMGSGGGGGGSGGLGGIGGGRLRKRRVQVQNYEDGAEGGAGAIAMEPTGNTRGGGGTGTTPKGLQIPQGGCFGGFRDSLHEITTHFAFRAISLVVILVSCAALATDDVYIQDRSAHGLRIATRVINIVFVVWLFMEWILKLLALGLSFGTSVECLLDTLMLLERVWCFFWFGFSTSSHLNPVAGLRPLMIIFRLPHLDVAARALTAQACILRPYLLASFVIWLFFALVGHQLFAGRFYHCLDSEGIRPDYRVIKNQNDCLMNNYTWIQPDFNFDGYGGSLVSLFALATFNGPAWINVLENAVDARPISEQPHMEANAGPGYAFVGLFIVCGVLLLGNMLIGVLVYVHRERNGFERLLTEGQLAGYREARAMNADEAAGDGEIPMPSSIVLQPFYDFVSSPPFEPVLIVMLVLDLVSCFLYGLLGPTSPKVLWIVFFWIFTFVYTAELCVKILGWREYFWREYPNLLDVVAVVSSFVLGVFCFDLSVWSLRILLRAFFLLKYVPFTLRRRAGRPRSILLNSAARVTPALVNLIGVLTVLIATFAMIGLASFKHVGGTEADELRPLTFHTFWQSMLVMVRLSFVAGWPQILDYIGRVEDCSVGPNGTCGNRKGALAFIVLFVLINMLVVVNMFLVLVLEIVDQLRNDQARADVESPRRGTQVGNENGTQLQSSGPPPAAAAAYARPPTAAAVPPAAAPPLQQPDPEPLAEEPQAPPQPQLPPASAASRARTAQRQNTSSSLRVNANGAGASVPENPEDVVVVPN